MKLNYKLPKKLQEALMLSKGEEIRYCSPYDLAYENNIAKKEYIKDGYVVVTNLRLVVLKSEEIVSEYKLCECEKIVCEPFIDNGILTVTKDGKQYCLARFSMRHVSRLSYIAKGAELLMNKKTKEVKPTLI